ncbi:S1C family serine protease [Ligilactobacillus pobuzihii]|uniref:Endopeptidase n=1 Tax=Ligilactobacillus pobuzihii TaxID=449659 RepID=A0A0R2LIW9_9LACO|nr:trypsin-like peptidase domain-containing protein [Ligilactobacillus pobuzihii]KRK09722.1 endopeptidase [Ligilactobacillus pobuzihii E100301 = KCTC 13174]KRO01685.1 endopeptidase [Ligilactobacillus pobuzihii]GEN48703.1 endopeptidase [Ligilactobacillus pobuzihii]
MNNNGQFDGEYKEVDPENGSPNNSGGPRGPKLWKVVLIALIAGVIGGGVVVGGYSWYQNQQDEQLNSDNSKAKTKTSNVKVNVSSDAEGAFNKIKGAVVSVEAYSKDDRSSSIAGMYGQSGDDSSGSQEEQASEGSGVIYKKSGDTAYVVTNNHVISGADRVETLMSDGHKLETEVVGHDAVSDLAVLKIDAKYVKQVASFGDSDKISVGETALAIGSPLGSDYATSLTQGIISAKKRTIDVTNSSGVATGQATVIQTDAAINPGNSGGPLINIGGQVIGINSMKLSSAGSSEASVEGMGFAIPSNEVVEIVNQLAENGKVSRPALGISLLDLDYISASDRQKTLKLPDSVTSGIVVMKVNSDSPLKDAGVKKYDVITGLGDKKVKDIVSLREALYEHKIGDKVKVKYYHDGKEKSTNVKLSLEANDSNTSAASNER